MYAPVSWVIRRRKSRLLSEPRRAASEGASTVAALVAASAAAAVAASSRVSGFSRSIRKLDGCGTHDYAGQPAGVEKCRSYST